MNGPQKNQVQAKAALQAATGKQHGDANATACNWPSSLDASETGRLNGSAVVASEGESV